MALPVCITAIGSFSPLGNTPGEVWQNYLDENTLIENTSISDRQVAVSKMGEKMHKEIAALRKSDSRYKQLDASVLYAILASRSAVKAGGWVNTDVFGINLGSSRGATHLFEEHYAEFLQLGTVSVQASPSTTLGNISSWVAQDLKSSGPEISHSVTCSTALHAVLNGVAWLRAGMADKFLTGGSEAPLTPFTIAQLRAMKIYAQQNGKYPSRAFDLTKAINTLVLGEGAATLCLEAGVHENALAYITGIGYATEILEHSVSISAEADCLQKSMQMALQDCQLNEVDVIVMHAPGTIKGDLSEYRAIQKVFGDKLPLLTTNKWKIGHTFGASGALSLELAALMMQHNYFIGIPFIPESISHDREIKTVLVNAVGFGGNAVSILLSKNS